MFGGWAIDKPLFDIVRQLVPDGGTLLEFGSGDGTNELLKHYKVSSIEHDGRFAVNRGSGHTCIFSPLIDGWYDLEVLPVSAEKIDLLLVDGPPGRLRSRMQKHFSLFKDITCPVIFDDVNRSFDFENMSVFCRHFNYSYTVHQGRNKAFAVCTKQAHG